MSFANRLVALVVLALAAHQDSGTDTVAPQQSGAPLTWDLVVTRDHAPLGGAEIVSVPAIWLDKDVGRDDGGTPWLVESMRLRGALAVGVRSRTDAAGRVSVDTSALRHPSGAYGTEVDVFIDFEGTWQRRRVDVTQTSSIELELGHVVHLESRAPWPADDLVLAVQLLDTDGVLHESWCRPRAGASVVAVPTGLARAALARVTIQPLVVGASRDPLVLTGTRLDDARVPGPALDGLVCTRLVVKDAAPRRAVWTIGADRGYPASIACRVAGRAPLQLWVRPGFEVALWAARGDVVAVELLGELATLAGDVAVIERGKGARRSLVLDLSAPVLVVAGRLLDERGAPCVDAAFDLTLMGGVTVGARTDTLGRFTAEVAAPQRLTGWSEVTIEFARPSANSPTAVARAVTAALAPRREAARRQRVDLGDVALKLR